MNVETSTADTKKISPAQSLFRVQSRPSLTTVSLEPLKLYYPVLSPKLEVCLQNVW